MTTTTKTAPTICRFGDDLTGYLDGLIEKSRISKKRLISSISFLTSFSDPLAILEKLHQTNDPHCYFEKLPMILPSPAADILPTTNAMDLIDFSSLRNGPLNFFSPWIGPEMPRLQDQAQPSF